MAFNFGSLINAGKNPQKEANAGADALMQSMGAGKEFTGTADALMNSTDKQDMNDVSNIFGLTPKAASPNPPTGQLSGTGQDEEENQDQMLATAALGPMGMLLG